MPRRARFARSQVLSAALRLVDRDGLEALTIRSLAAELGTSPMTVYGYVRDKDELLTGLVELAFTEVTLPPAGGSWQERLHELAEQLRRALTNHPALLPLVVSHHHQGPAVLDRIEMVLAVLDDAGFGPHEAALAFRTVTGYVTGAAIAELARPSPAAHTGARAAALQLEPSAGSHPHLAAARTADTSGPDDTFAYGLKVILDGLSARVRQVSLCQPDVDAGQSSPGVVGHG